MRLRRRVALYSQNEASLGVVAFLLQLRLHLDVVRCGTAADIALAGCELTILVLNSPDERNGLERLCGELQGKSVLFDQKGLLSEAAWAAGAYVCGKAGPGRLLDTVRVLLTHKRGPKPRGGLSGSLPHPTKEDHTKGRGDGGAVQRVENQKAVSHPSPRALENASAFSHIPTAPAAAVSFLSFRAHKHIDG